MWSSCLLETRWRNLHRQRLLHLQASKPLKQDICLVTSRGSRLESLQHSPQCGAGT